MSIVPNDVFLEGIESPKDILDEVCRDINSRNSSIEALVKTRLLADRLVLSFIILSHKKGSSFTLFDAAHRKNLEYPVAIDPPENDVPEFLRRTKIRRGIPSLGKIHAPNWLEGTPDKVVENKWVAATPEEFRTKLETLFRLDHVKATIISLQSNPVEIDEDWSQEPEIDPRGEHDSKEDD